jgi:hypothetical protein
MPLTQLLGTIEPQGEFIKGRDDWIGVVAEHAQLSPFPARMGIDPFSKGPMEFKAKPDTARVLTAQGEVGSIYWALDDSRRLVVDSAAGSESEFESIARTVAAELGWQFTRQRGV